MIRSFILAAPTPLSGLFHKVNHGFEYAGPFVQFHLVGAHKAGLHQVVGQVFVIARRHVGDKLEERVLNVRTERQRHAKVQNALFSIRGAQQVALLYVVCMQAG
jgi:hypothetical protein